MSSNAAKMTLEERLVQHIKSTGLGALIDDEDAITELTRRAIREALTQPTRTMADYGRVVEADSPAVKAAREVATAAATMIVAAEVARMEATPEFMKAVREALLLCLPKVIEHKANEWMTSWATTAAQTALETLRQQAGRL